MLDVSPQRRPPCVHPICDPRQGCPKPRDERSPDLPPSQFRPSGAAAAAVRRRRPGTRAWSNKERKQTRFGREISAGPSSLEAAA